MSTLLLQSPGQVGFLQDPLQRKPNSFQRAWSGLRNQSSKNPYPTSLFPRQCGRLQFLHIGSRRARFSNPYIPPHPTESFITILPVNYLWGWV